MRILLAVPTFEHIQNDVFEAIYNLDRCGHTVDFQYVAGYDCAFARNVIADIAIAQSYDYVLMVDSDTVIPKDTLKHLLDPPVDIVLGVCPRKNTTTKQTALCPADCLDMSKSLTYDELGEDRIELTVGGFACALIRTEVFLEMLYPYFQYERNEDRSVLSEDYYFCQKAISTGFQIWADPRVKCGHLAKYYQYE